MFNPHSLAERLARLPDDAKSIIFDKISQKEAHLLAYDWRFWARPSQLPPNGLWSTWLVLAGRGFGKTRMGAEWIRLLVEGNTPFTAPKGAPKRIALVGQSNLEARAVMIEGESGLLAVSPRERRPKYEPSLRRLTWENGIVATLFSADEPDQLRGPQHGAAWCDELAKWRYPDDAWMNLLFGLRLGSLPRVMVTTTPRPVALLKTLMEDPATVVTRGSTLENKANLSRRFLNDMDRLYAGTRMGRQELEGELLEDIPGALWMRPMIKVDANVSMDNVSRCIVAVDPPVTAGEKADACGIIVVGLLADQRFVVLEDFSIQGARPEKWARQVVAAYHEYSADQVVAEVNNGGDLVETLIRQIDATINYRPVRASRGKYIRAEPVAALYEQGRVVHRKPFPLLEDEMCSYVPGSTKSPDRMDALVWGLTELNRRTSVSPRMRKL